MQRVSGANYLANGNGIGKNAYQDYNPATGQPGTTPNAAAFNALQEEVAGFIESKGLVLDPNDNTQLAQAIAKIGMSYNGRIGINASVTLTAAQAGGVFEIMTAGVTVTLPEADESANLVFTFFTSFQTGIAQLVAGNFNSAYGSSVGEISLPPGSSIALFCDGTSYDAVGGSGAVGAGAFNNKTNLAASTALVSGQAGGLFEIATAGITITLPPAAQNIGRAFTFYTSFLSGSATIAAANINSAYGSTVTSITMPQGSSITLVSDGTSYDAVSGSGAIGLPVKAQTASGVGQLAQATVVGGSSGSITLPAGGTWEYFYSNNGGVNAGTGIAAGGSVIFSGNVINAATRCIRIA